MAKNLADSISKLRKSAAQLNQLTDQANDTIKEVEHFLNRECSVGVIACIKLSEYPMRDEHGDEVGSASDWLEYRRVNGKYRIALVWATDMDPDDEKVKPLSDCSREEKLDAVAKLPELIEAIAAKLDEKVATALEAAQTLSRVLGALNGKAGA